MWGSLTLTPIMLYSYCRPRHLSGQTSPPLPPSHTPPPSSWPANWKEREPHLRTSLLTGLSSPQQTLPRLACRQLPHRLAPLQSPGGRLAPLQSPGGRLAPLQSPGGRLAPLQSPSGRLAPLSGQRLVCSCPTPSPPPWPTPLPPPWPTPLPPPWPATTEEGWPLLSRLLRRSQRQPTLRARLTFRRGSQSR